MIKALLMDIDGVLTDGKEYISAFNSEYKTIAFKDLDAITSLKNDGIIVGAITGENSEIVERFRQTLNLDAFYSGCKCKDDILSLFQQKFQIEQDDIAYIGDGKYDLSMIAQVGLSFCPKDAIGEVKRNADIVLESRGGEGCIAEIYDILQSRNRKKLDAGNSVDNRTSQIILEHRDVINKILEDDIYLTQIENARVILVDSLKIGGTVFLCGNGGSAADAQHIAAELVSRFYMEREAISAEALSTNTSIITAIANDYDYSKIFARQLQARARANDVLIGITTSGTSKNVVEAMIEAKKKQMKTILLTGDIKDNAFILDFTDCALKVPSTDTPRIQEVHILTGHILSELVEKEISNNNMIGEKNE